MEKTTAKKTQREYFTEIKAVLADAGKIDLVEFVDGRIAQLDKKSANRKPSKSQADNEDIKVEILANLSAIGQTVSDLQKTSAELGGYSNQKISAMLRILVKENKVVKVTGDKGKSFFSLA